MDRNNYVQGSPGITHLGNVVPGGRLQQDHAVLEGDVPLVGGHVLLLGHPFLAPLGLEPFLFALFGHLQLLGPAPEFWEGKK